MNKSRFKDGISVVLISSRFTDYEKERWNYLGYQRKQANA